MAKNKKKKAQMFKNFLAFKAGQVNPTLQMSAPQTSSFQTPHSNQEKLTELIDDNAGGETIQPSSSGTNSTPGQTVNKWTALKPAEDTNIQVNMRNDPKRQNLTIVEGTASKIQLVMDSSKKTVAQSSSPKPAEESKSDTPTAVVPTVSPQPKPTNIPTPPQKFAAAPNTKTNYPKFTTPHKSAMSRSNNYVGYPAGIPRSMLKISEIPKNIPTRTGATNSPVFNDLQENSSQMNQGDQADNRNTPIWDLAPHAKPTWPQTQPYITTAGWPKSRNSNNPQEYWTPQDQSNQIHDQVHTDQVQQLSVQTDMNAEPPQAYSPSDIYSEGANNELHARKAMMQERIGITDEEVSPEIIPSGSKRLSAFERLGPMAEQPKKTKLTISLLCEKDVRNVIDETDDVPTHLREYITNSTEEIVVKYLEMWPFKKNVVPARTATVRQSKSAMMMEREYMEEAYSRDNRFILVTVTGYPPSWKKEDVLDAVLESVDRLSFIPCFIEFTKVKCKFLVIRCRLALLNIHKYGFIIRKNETELIVSLSNIHMNLNQLDFVPRLMLRKLMLSKLDETSLDLSSFTTQIDISHFIYFPLDRVSNQTELVQLQSSVPWSSLTSLNLSNNRITSIIGIDLLHTTPNLKHLNLSHNLIEKVTMLLCCRNLPLKTINLEGNPLCNDYIAQEHYIKVLTLLFCGLQEIDGVKFKNNAVPDPKRNYGPEESKEIVDKVLEVMFPLLEASPEKRLLMENLYDVNAVLTITFMYKLRYGSVYKHYRNLFIRARVMDECDMESIVGAANIAKLAMRWPDMIHDPTTFHVDVLFHNESTTIVRIGGIVKISTESTESLTDVDHLLSFTRTLVLHTKHGSEYKITNELLYWDLPEKAYAETAFKGNVVRVRPKNSILRFDTVKPEEELKESLVQVFMQITELEKAPSQRCLTEKDWNFKNALEYFSKLVKLDNLDRIMNQYDAN